MATPAAILSILVDVNSGKASVALAGVQKQLVTTNTHADALEKHSGRLSKSLGSISAPAERSTRSLKELGKVALEAGGAFAAFEAAKTAIETTVELGHATERLSAITGLDAKQASQWIETMKVRGISAKAVGLSFITLSRNIRNAENGSKTSKKAFDELGISMDGLKKSNTEQVILEVADGMAKVQDPARRAAIAQGLFGRAAQGLIPVLHEGRKGVQDMLDTTQKFGAFLPNHVKGINEAVDADRQLALAGDGLKIAFTEKVLPTLLKVSSAVLGFIAQMRSGQGVGGQFAAIIGAAFQKVKDAVGVVVPIVTTLIGQFKAGDPAIRAMAIGVAGLVVALKAAAVAQAALNTISEASPWVRAATLIAALVTALLVLQEKNKGVHDALENAWQRLRTIAETVFPVIRDIATRAFTIIVGAANALRDAFNAVFPVAKRIVIIAFDAIMVAVDLLKAQFQIAWDVIGPLVRRTIDAIKFAIDNILIPIFEKLKGPLQTLGDVFKTVFGHAKDAVKLAMDFMLGAFAAFLHVVADVAGVKLPFLGRVFGNAAKSIDDAATSVDNLKRQLDGLPAKTSTEVDVQVNFLSNLQGAIAAIGATISNVGAQVGGAAPVAGTQRRFMGGLVDQPGYFAGEEAPQHPEVIVATNPAYRQQNLGYWAMAGRMLGIPGFATGGLANAGAMVGATDPWAGKTAGSWMKGKAAKWVEPLKQQLIQRASFGGGSVGNLANLWVQGGGPANVAQIMGAIAMAESGGKNVIQQGQPYATTGWGLWQITPGNSEPQFGINQALLIPINNARAAVAKYDSQGLGAWTTYTSGAYKQFLGAPAIGGGGGGGVGAVGGLSQQVLAAIAFARRNGWAGSVISGFRTRAAQAALYARYLAGGHIAAPPGTSSHEFGNAVDVTDVPGFAHAMALAPAGARLISGASYGDANHFSITGHRKGGIYGKIPRFAKGGINGKIPRYATGGIRGFAKGGINLPSATNILGLPALPSAGTQTVPSKIAATIGGNRNLISSLEQSFTAISGFYDLAGTPALVDPDTGLRDQHAITARLDQLNILISYRQRIFQAWSMVVALTQRLIQANDTMARAFTAKANSISTKGLKGNALTAARKQITDARTAAAMYATNEGAAKGNLASAIGDRQTAWISLQGLLGDKFTIAGTASQAISTATSALDNAPVTDDATVALLQQQLQQANLRTAVSQAQYATLPFGGSFATGGIVPGPIGMPSVIIAHGGETVTPAGPTVHVHIAPGMDWLRQFISVEVDSNTRGQARNASRSLPGSR